MTIATRILPIVALTLATACTRDEPDAYGNFEAEEVIVSAETAGQLVQFAATEGIRLEAGAVVGAIETEQLELQRRDLTARRDAARARHAEVGKQAAVFEAQREMAQREYERTRRLFEQQAATAQQLDRAERDYRTLVQQIEAARAAGAATLKEAEAIEAQIALVSDRVQRARITNPIRGTVLTTYAERGELVQPGQPLYKIANLDTLTLRAFISGAQLAQVKLGSSVTVRIDDGNDTRTLPGRVAWISSQAEFTPTPIQTREERTEQVYAVKVQVANTGGALKLGMPAEVVITP